MQTTIAATAKTAHTTTATMMPVLSLEDFFFFELPIGAGVGLEVGRMRTASRTCTTPFEAMISAWITVASLIITTAFTVTVTLLPCKVVMCMPLERSVERIAPETTWYRRTLVSAGVSAKSSVPLGSASKASFVGAKTVKGPSLESTSTRSAATTASTRIERSSVAIARSTILGSGVAVGGGVKVVGAGVGRDVGEKLGRNVGRKLGRVIGAELGTGVGATLGRDVGVESGRDVDAELGSDVDAELGSDVDAELGIDVDAEIGIVVGAELGSSCSTAGVREHCVEIETRPYLLAYPTTSVSSEPSLGARTLASPEPPVR